MIGKLTDQNLHILTNYFFSKNHYVELLNYKIIISSGIKTENAIITRNYFNIGKFKRLKIATFQNGNHNFRTP